MNKFLTVVLLSVVSLLVWTSAYPQDWSGVPNGDFESGDIIDHNEFNANNEAIKSAINGRVPVPSNCTPDQIIKYTSSGWQCASASSAVDIEYTDLVRCTNATSCEAYCSSGKQVVGGQCVTGNPAALMDSRAVRSGNNPGFDGWLCLYQTSIELYAGAICL